jgi:hypothetical protein
VPGPALDHHLPDLRQLGLQACTTTLS